jgi:hypothetical protein
MVGALVVLVSRRWPASPSAPRPGPPPPPPEPTLIGLAGEAIDPDACAGPALRELTRHPNWSFTLAERESTDVVGPDPDETLQTVAIDARTATWRDGDLPQSLELDPAERSELLAAAARSCREIRAGNGFTSRYVVLQYGTDGADPAKPEPGGRVNRDAITLPGESRAAIDTIAVMDRVRARYTAARIGIAEAMTLTLHGPRRTGANAWAPYTIVIRPDGRIVDQAGDELQSPLAPADHVGLLDWAMQLPATVRGTRPLTGTLEIAGARRPVALQLDAMVHRIEGSSGWRSMLDSWWANNLPPRD